MHFKLVKNIGLGKKKNHINTHCVWVVYKTFPHRKYWINKKKNILLFLNISYSEDTDFSLQGNNTQAVPTRAD